MYESTFYITTKLVWSNASHKTHVGVKYYFIFFKSRSETTFLLYKQNMCEPTFYITNKTGMEQHFT